MISRDINLPKNKSFFLFGARQTGKTTLIESQFPKEKSITYNLLNSDEYYRLKANPSIFRNEVLARSSDIQFVIVDEVQKIPPLLDEIHFLIEQKEAPIFVLTGSSARKLKRAGTNMLAGRALTYKLLPLSFFELGDLFNLEKSLNRGMLPGIYLENSSKMAQEILSSYVNTYLKEEIELEAQLRNVNAFIHFLKIAGQENGNLINSTNIGRDAGVSYKTVQNYYKILEDTLLGFFLYPYLKSPRKRLSLHPKFYFLDTGLVRAITKKQSLSLEKGTSEYGHYFEHFMILEIIKYAEYRRLDLDFSFYRTERGAEVDLIIETPKNEVLAIEIKSRSDVQSAHLKGLRSFAEVCPKAKLLCLSQAPRRTKIGDCLNLPWQEVFEILG